jgi:hypothetical protein
MGPRPRNLLYAKQGAPIELLPQKKDPLFLEGSLCYIYSLQFNTYAWSFEIYHSKLIIIYVVLVFCFHWNSHDGVLWLFI